MFVIISYILIYKKFLKGIWVMGKVIDLDQIEQQEWEEENAYYKQSDSKSKIKRDMLEITDFGRELTELNNTQLDKLPIDENLKKNILTARNMQKIALKRQIQFIGKLLRKVDNLEDIQEAHSKLVNKNKEANLVFHRLEHIREALLASETADSMLQQVLEEFPEIDIQNLRQLIRNHHKEMEKNKPKKSYRQIFQVLKEASPEIN